MSEQEGRRREKPRHPEVPAGATVQKQAMAELGVKSPYRMDLLASACIKEGTPPVLIPEGNAYKFGKWYPVALLDAMRRKNAERPPTAPTGWRSTDDLSNLFTLDYNQTRDIALQVMADPRMEGHFGVYTSGNGSVTDFFDEAAAEAIRRRASQRTDTARSASVREAIKPSTSLPPAAGPENLLPHERAAVASADRILMAALNSVQGDIANLRSACARVRDGRIRQNIERELTTIEGFAGTYQQDVLVQPAVDMRPRVSGLQRALERVTTTLKQAGALYDEDD